jgi:hypothetical protein
MFLLAELSAEQDFSVQPQSTVAVFFSRRF